MDSNIIKIIFIISALYITILFCFCGCKPKQSEANIQVYYHWATQDNEDALDFYIDKYENLNYSDGRSFPIKKDIFHVLSIGEQQKAKNIMRDYFSLFEYEKDTTYKWKPYPLRTYYRQHIGYIEDGHIMDFVNIFTNYQYKKDPDCDCIYMPDITQTIINVSNGGNHYGTIIIDITEKRVISFWLNDYK